MTCWILKPKLFNLSLLVSLCNFNYLQISARVKWLNSKKILEILFEKKPSLHKKFLSIYREVLSVTWPYFTVLKYTSKISNKVSEKYNKKVFYKKAVLKYFAIFTGKYLCWSLFFNKYAGLQFCNFIKKRLQHRCFPVNIAKFLRTPVSKNICERLFECFPTWTNHITSNIGSGEGIFSKTK